jgi:hypothetical protein
VSFDAGVRFFSLLALVAGAGAVLWTSRRIDDAAALEAV